MASLFFWLALDLMESLSLFWLTQIDKGLSNLTMVILSMQKQVFFSTKQQTCHTDKSIFNLLMQLPIDLVIYTIFLINQENTVPWTWSVASVDKTSLS